MGRGAFRTADAPAGSVAIDHRSAAGSPRRRPDIPPAACSLPENGLAAISNRDSLRAGRAGNCLPSHHVDKLLANPDDAAVEAQTAASYGGSNFCVRMRVSAVFGSLIGVRYGNWRRRCA